MEREDPRNLSPKVRVAEPYHHIDPGFINERLCFTTFGPKFHAIYEKHRKPGTDHMERLYNNHLLVEFVLRQCRAYEIPPLSEILRDPIPGKVFCSTETSKGGGSKVYKKNTRARSRIILPYKYDRKVILDFGTEHFVADTGKMEMSEESVASFVGVIRKVTDKEIIIYPLIIGAPSFDHWGNKNIGVDLSWDGWDAYQLVPEDIEEFQELKTIPDPGLEEWQGVMSKLPEDQVKQNIVEILKDSSKKDWGGEQNDHFTSNVHVNGTRKTAAFLLKGPSKFSPMKITHLGKNGDQILRLSHSPAQILIVQHSHDITEEVREHLRSVAVQPSKPRHYCFIDGKDTYKLLKAYGKI